MIIRLNANENHRFIKFKKTSCAPPKDRDCFRKCLFTWYNAQQRAFEDEWNRLEERGVEDPEDWIEDDYVAHIDKEEFIDSIPLLFLSKLFISFKEIQNVL